MDLENQKRVKEFAEEYGAENLVVVLGAAEGEAAGLAAETVIGELLKDNGLIDESLLVFEVQYRLSGYYGGIKDGSYVLNTAQTVDEMLEILAGVNTEGQPSAE